MEKRTIEAMVPANKQKGTEQLGPASLTVDFPSTVKEAVEWAGEEALLSNAFANWRVTLQGNIRNALKRGESQDAIQARLGTSKMGVAAQGAKVDPVQAYIAMYAAATPEKRAQMEKELKERAAQKK